MSFEPLTQEDFDFLAYYGRTMASVQEFEFAVIRLARLILAQLPEAVPFELVCKKLRRQFEEIDGPFAKLLGEWGHTPQEVMEGIQHILVGRNNLAHEFLLLYMLKRNAGAVDRAEWTSILREAETDFLECRDFINALCESVAHERGEIPEAVGFTLDDIRETFDQQDTQELLSAYGSAMHAVQLWEFSLKGLVTYWDLPGDNEDTTFDEGWEPVRRTLTTAAGPLRRRLEEQGYGSRHLHAELETFRSRRNELAHEFFLDYARIRAAEGPGAHDAALGFLKAMQLFFSEQKTQLDGLADAQAKERGWDPNDRGGLTDEDLRRIFAEEKGKQR